MATAKNTPPTKQKSKTPVKKAINVAIEKIEKKGGTSNLKADIQKGYNDLVKKAKTAITKKLYSVSTEVLENLLQKIEEGKKQMDQASGQNSKQKSTSSDKSQSKKSEDQKVSKPPFDKIEMKPSKKDGIKESEKKEKAKPEQKGGKKEAGSKNTSSSRPHGKDQHFIPVKNEQHLIKGREKLEFEKAFQHKEETALHLEQQRVKNNLATRQKKVFVTPRQS